jgi:Protein of unknown function (DUF3309)
MSRTAWLLLIVLLILFVMPMWPYSGAWGWYPSEGLGVVFLVLLILLLLGRL